MLGPNRRKTARAAISTTALVFLTSCGTSTIDSRPLVRHAALGEKTDGFKVQGLPYFLPNSAISVSLESQKDDKGNHKALVLNTAAKLVPDPEAGYLLRSPDFWYASKTHNLKVIDGLLSSVTTEDENQIGNIIADIITSAANIHALGATGASSQAGSQKQFPDEPEIKELLSMIPSGVHEFVFKGDDSKSDQATAAIPGTDGILDLKYTPEDLYPATTNGVSDGSKPLEAKPGEFSGIYARTVKPTKVTIALRVQLEKFYDWRIAKLESEIEANKEAMKPLEKQIEANQTELAGKLIEASGLETALKKLEAERDRLEVEKTKHAENTPARIQAELDYAKAVVEVRQASEKLGAVQTEVEALQKPTKDKAKLETANNTINASSIGSLARNAAWKNTNKGPRDLVSRSSVALLPDAKLTVLIPLTKSALGLSKNTLTLQSGIVTDFKTEKPSVGLAAVRILRDTVSKIVEIPAQIIKLRFDFATKEKEMANAEKELQELKAKIAAGKPTPSEHELEVEKLKQEKEIAQLQKEIAELRAAMDKLKVVP